MNIGYKLVKNNMPATAEKAPYLGMAIPVGSLAYDNILRDMIDNGTKMSLATARYFLEAFYDYAARKIAADAVRINTGTVAIYPMIDGSFDSEDAEFDPERPSLPDVIREQVEIQIKYEGYIKHQLIDAEKQKKIESRLLPKDIDYSKIKGLRIEAAQKLQQIRPASIGQAARISGVNPADISVLTIWLAKNPKDRKQND